MARIPGVCAREAGPRMRPAQLLTRRHTARLTGHQPERTIKPLKLYGHVPGLLRAHGSLEQATATLHRVHKRFKALAELKANTLTHCEYCIDIGSQIARSWGLSDEELLALPSSRTSALVTFFFLIQINSTAALFVVVDDAASDCDELVPDDAGATTISPAPGRDRSGRARPAGTIAGGSRAR